MFVLSVDKNEKKTHTNTQRRDGNCQATRLRR